MSNTECRILNVEVEYTSFYLAPVFPSTFNILHSIFNILYFPSSFFIPHFSFLISVIPPINSLLVNRSTGQLVN